MTSPPGCSYPHSLAATEATSKRESSTRQHKSSLGCHCQKSHARLLQFPESLLDIFGDGGFPVTVPTDPFQCHSLKWCNPSANPQDTSTASSLCCPISCPFVNMHSAMCTCEHTHAHAHTHMNTRMHVQTYKHAQARNKKGIKNWNCLLWY